MLQRFGSLGHNRYLGAVAAGSVAGLVLLLFFLLLRGQRDTVVLEVRPIEDPSVVRVYVGGEVTSPGLFSLQRGSRVADAIDAAGGLLTGADSSLIWMAAVLEDADQVIVPARRPTPAPTVHQPPVPLAGNPGVPPTAPAGNGAAAATAPPNTEPALIDINSAPASEFERLPGIGPAISERIVAYRIQNGPFQTIDELEAVSGISQRMVDELRPLLTLGP